MTKYDTQKINEALSLLNEAAKEKKDELNDLLDSKYGDLKAAVSGVESEVADHAHHGAERLAELKDAAQQRATNAVHEVDRKAHEDPWKTLGWSVAGALAIGFLLGRKE